MLHALLELRVSKAVPTHVVELVWPNLLQLADLARGHDDCA